VQANQEGITMENSQSEVARIMACIELESEAMQNALTGLATAAKHTIVAHRYEAISHYYDQLIPLVGEKQAAALLVKSSSHGLEALPGEATERNKP